MPALLERILAVGRERGCRFARVHVFIANTKAEAMHLKAGFQQVDEPKRNPHFEKLLGCHGMKLLTRPL